MANKSPTEVGKRLLEARSAAGLSQQTLAEAAGISQTTVAQLETGRNSGETYFFAIADALGVSARWLALGEACDPEQSEKKEALRPTGNEIAAVSRRCEATYHSITALHDLCTQAIGGIDDPVTIFVVLRETLRGIARDMEVCAETLTCNIGGNGFFVEHYGSV